MPSLRLASARGIGLAVHVLGVWLPVAVVYGSVESGVSEFSPCRIQAGASGPPWWDYGQWDVVAQAVRVERRAAPPRRWPDCGTIIALSRCWLVGVAVRQVR